MSTRDYDSAIEGDKIEELSMANRELRFNLQKLADMYTRATGLTIPKEMDNLLWTRR